MKRSVLALIVALLVLLSALPAAAQTAPDLSALARFFPADIPIFISFRTDDGFIATLNNLAERITARVSNGVMDQSLQEALDELVQSLYPGGNFQENVRPWLGDTAAVGFLSLTQQMTFSADLDSDEQPVLIAISIKNPAAALDFVVNLLNQNRAPFFQTTGDSYTLLVIGQTTMPSSLDNSTFVVVRDEALLISASSDTSLFAPDTLPSPSLADTPRFTTALGWLPAQSYNAIVYNDAFAGVLNSLPADDLTAGFLTQILGQVGLTTDIVTPQIFGFTLLDGTTFTIDGASYADPSASPLTSAALRPVDPAFAARIPANVPLAVHASDLKLQIEAAALGINTLLETLSTELADTQDIEEARMELRKQLARANNLFTSLTKLDFVEDVLSWLDGDYIAFLGLNPALDTTSMMGIMTAFPLELGIGIEVTDTAKAQAMFEGLTLGLRQLVQMANASASTSEPEPQLAVTTNELAGAAVTVLTITSRDLPWPIELLMGTNDRVFAIGTRSAVAAMFSADGGLTTNEAFRAAQAYMLPNANSIAWLNPAGLLPLADLVEALDSGPSAEADARAVRAFLNLITSGTITASNDLTKNLTLVRMTLTLNAE